MSVLDVLTVASRGHGVFEANGCPQAAHFEAHFKPGFVIHAATDGTAHTSEQEMAAVFSSIIGCREGEFELRRVQAAELKHTCEFNFDAILLQAAKTLDETRSGAEQEDDGDLPSDETLFVISWGRAAEVQHQLSLWPVEMVLGLQEGASGASLAQTTGIDVRHVLAALKTLRALGLIAPKREAVPPAVHSAPQSVFQPALPEWYTGGNLLEQAPSAAIPKREGSLSKVRPARKPSGLSRILSFFGSRAAS